MRKKLQQKNLVFIILKYFFPFNFTCKQLKKCLHLYFLKYLVNFQFKKTNFNIKRLDSYRYKDSN